ncbi:glycosyltransferase family 4 protein [Pseudomonas sp. TCU-HL1]|uniref:glycosyltransferase family 4 protein n=1 Tax=Pseudomonas sp. TCU-HL1 TaxID=1856685 RepID=UPI0008561192|nr:glycosyltransferase family 4 protein [Pseudomonas sp. TCU-HL1]AOE83161.1 glycosyl transferase family 1 [Pseudomonas sp. TCU-HL1]
MKKIVFIHLFNDRSGSPKVLSQVIKVAQNLGFDIETLTSSHKNGFLDNPPGVLRKIFYRRSEKKLLTLCYYLISQAILFAKCLQYRKKDAIFYINTMMPFGAALAARLINKPVLYHVHETSITPRPLKSFLRWIIRITASKIIFVSNYLLQAEGFDKKQQHVIHNAIDICAEQAPKKPSVDSFNVIMICSLKGYKGVYEFLQVAESLIKNPLFRFTLVLNANPEEINSWFSGTAIPANVTLLPRQTDVKIFYESADLLVNFTRPNECIETFGLTILEGMSYGVPVIVPPVGGPAEIVSNDCEGFLIPSYEVKKISDVIERLAGNIEQYSRLSRNAHARAKDFSLAMFEEKIAGVIDS